MKGPEMEPEAEQSWLEYLFKDAPLPLRLFVFVFLLFLLQKAYCSVATSTSSKDPAKNSTIAEPRVKVVTFYCDIIA